MRPGDAVKQYDLLCRVQSDKATIDVSSAYDGTIHSLSGSVGDILAVGEPLCAFSVEDHEDHEDHEDVGGEDGPSEDKRGVRDDCELKDAEDATLDSIRGFAPDGSLKRKLTSYRRSMMHAMQQVRQFGSPTPRPPLHPYTRTPTRPTATTATTATTRQASDIPHCHALDIVTGLDKISTPIAVKALSRAVECVPIMHALLSPEDESYTIPAGVHVGVAVSTPSGLAVPCLHDAQQKSVEEIGADIARLRRLAIDRRLSRDDTEGGTITLSNIGSVGLISGLGIIQPKQTALVTVGKAVNGTAHVSVSADHRLVDGLTLAEFLAAFRRALCDEASARELGRADEPV